MFARKQAKKSEAAETAAAAAAVEGGDATKEKKKKKKSSKSEGDAEAATGTAEGGANGEEITAPKEKMPKLVLRFKKYQFAKNKKAFVQ